MDFVAVDLGASCTRYVSDDCQFHTMGNQVVFMENLRTGNMEETPVSVEITSGQINDNLEMLIYKTSGGESADTPGIFPMHILMEQLTERVSAPVDHPVMGENKTKQRINYANVVASVALSKIQRSMSNDIIVFMALPPTELFNKERARENLVGSYEVIMPRINGGLKVNFNIVKVACQAESHMALMSYMVDLNGKPKSTYRSMTDQTVLSIDIGASTTDLAIIKNTTYLEKTGRTIPVGGNFVRDRLQEWLTAKTSESLPTDAANEILAEGRYRDGASYVVITDMMNQFKEECAQEIYQNMRDYFTAIKIPLSSIGYIIVSGGGSMPSFYVDEHNEVKRTAEPMSTYLTQIINRRSPNTKVISYGDNPRLANIYGLYIRAKHAMNKLAGQQVQNNGVEASGVVTPMESATAQSA